MMIQATLVHRPIRQWDSAASGRTARHDWSGLLTLFRIPKPGETIPDDLRHLLEENDMFDEDGDDRHSPAPSTPPAGFATGMAFCVPALMVIGLLYALLK